MVSAVLSALLGATARLNRPAAARPPSGSSSWRLESWSFRSTALTWASTVFGEMSRRGGDLLVEVAAGDQAQHLALAERELVELGVELGLRDLALKGVEHEAGEPRREDGVAVADPADRRREVLAGDRLGHVPARARADHRDHVLGARPRPTARGIAAPAARARRRGSPRLRRPRACARRAARRRASPAGSPPPPPPPPPPRHGPRPGPRARPAPRRETARGRRRSRRWGAGAHPRLPSGACSRRSIVEADLRPAAGDRPELGPTAGPFHPADDRLAHTATVRGHVGRARTRAPDRGRRPRSAARRPRRRRGSAPARRACLAAFSSASRAAPSTASARSSSSQSPTTTTSTATRWSSSTDSAAERSAAAKLSSAERDRRRRRASREARAPAGARAPRPRAGRRLASASGSGSAARSRADARRARCAPGSGSAPRARPRGCARAAKGTAPGSAPPRRPRPRR